MQVKTLTIDNFISYAHTEINFDDFDSAVVIGKQCGDLKISNGVGKSTLFSAIKFGFFGEVDFAHYEKIIRNDTNSCKIGISFIADDGEFYKIERSRHRKTGAEVKLFRHSNNVWEDISNRTNSQTEKRIEEIVKINYRTFCNSTLFAQNDITGLAALTPADRKKLLRETLQLGVYGKYEKGAKEKATALSREIDKIKVIISSLGDPEKDITQLSQDLSKLHIAISEQTELLAVRKKDLEAGNDKYHAISKEIETLEQASKLFDSQYKSILSDIDRASSAVKSYEIKFVTVKTAGTSLASEVKKLVNELKQVENSKHRDKNIVLDEINSSTKELIEKKANLGSLNSKLTELKIPIPDGGKCKHCRRTISEDDRKICIQAINEELTAVNQDILKIQTSIKDLSVRIDERTREYKEIENIEKAIAAKKQDLLSKQKELNDKKTIFVEYGELVEKAKCDLSEKQSSMGDLLANKPNDNSTIISKLVSDQINIKHTIFNLQKDMDDIYKLIMSFTNSKAVVEHKIVDRTKDISKMDELNIQLLELDRKYMIAQKVVNAFGSRGIPTMITHSILDDLQISTNKFLTKLKPDLQARFVLEKERAAGDLGDTLDIVFQLGKNELEFAQLSGAQKIIAAFAFRLGLAEIIKRRLGIAINLLLIDEVEQAFDEANVETFGDVIRKISEDYKLIVISHNNDIKDRFHKAILVEQDENLISKASVVNAW